PAGPVTAPDRAVPATDCLNRPGQQTRLVSGLAALQLAPMTSRPVSTAITWRRVSTSKGDQSATGPIQEPLGHLSGYIYNRALRTTDTDKQEASLMSELKQHIDEAISSIQHATGNFKPSHELKLEF